MRPKFKFWRNREKEAGHWVIISLRMLITDKLFAKLDKWPYVPPPKTQPPALARAYERFYKWQMRLLWILLSAIVPFIIIGAATNNGPFELIVGVPIFLLCCILFFQTIICGPIYFYQRYKAGYKLGYWVDTPRKSRQSSVSPKVPIESKKMARYRRLGFASAAVLCVITFWVDFGKWYGYSAILGMVVVGIIMEVTVKHQNSHNNDVANLPQNKIKKSQKSTKEHKSGA